MPLERFRSFDEARDALLQPTSEPRLLDRIRRLWAFSTRLVKHPPPRGLRFFRDLDEANADRVAWTTERARRLRRERRAVDD